jgi:hypothetical protein
MQPMVREHGGDAIREFRASPGETSLREGWRFVLEPPATLDRLEHGRYKQS